MSNAPISLSQWKCDHIFVCGFCAAGESWGHASTIRVVLYWEDNQRYTQQTVLYYFMDS